MLVAYSVSESRSRSSGWMTCRIARRISVREGLVAMRANPKSTRTFEPALSRNHSLYSFEYAVYDVSVRSIAEMEFEKIIVKRGKPIAKFPQCAQAACISYLALKHKGVADERSDFDKKTIVLVQYLPQCPSSRVISL